MMHACFLLVCLPVLGLMRCDNTPNATFLRLAGPSDLALAGPWVHQPDKAVKDYRQYLFVAASKKNIVYVLDLSTYSFVRSPNLYFPLEIPVGQAPVSLAVTQDKNYVLVLCAIDKKIFVINAQTLRLVRDAQGAPLTFSVGDGPSQIITHPWSLQGKQPQDTFFITHAQSKQVLVLDLTKDASGLPIGFELKKTYSQVGAVSRAVVTQDAQYLFAADVSMPLVHRLDLQTGAVMELDVESPAVDVTLTPKDARLLVANAEDKVVLVLDPKSGKRIDTNPYYAPTSDARYTTTGMHIGMSPRRLALVSNTDRVNQNVEFQMNCSYAYASNGQVISQVQDNQTLSSYGIVATQSGHIFFFNPDSTSMLNDYYCAPPLVISQLSSVDGSNPWQNGSIFESCNVSRLRRHQYCDPNLGVLLYPGYTPDSEWVLHYEQSLPESRRSLTQGGFVSDSRFMDTGVDFLTMTDLRVGDKLVVTSPPVSTQPCVEQYGDAQNFSLREWTITSIGRDEQGQSFLQLDKPVKQACFLSADRVLNYQIIASGSFLFYGARANDTSFKYLSRLDKGSMYGILDDANIKFRLKADLVPTRGQAFRFSVKAPFTLTTGGVATDSNGVNGPLGRIPSAVIVTPSGLDKDYAERIFVAYEGSDSLVAFNTGGNTYFTTSTIKVFR